MLRWAFVVFVLNQVCILLGKVEMRRGGLRNESNPAYHFVARNNKLQKSLDVEIASPEDSSVKFPLDDNHR